MSQGSSPFGQYGGGYTTPTPFAGPSGIAQLQSDLSNPNNSSQEKAQIQSELATALKGNNASTQAAEGFGALGNTGSVVGAGNPYNPLGGVLPTYGGYQGGFGDTMAMEGNLAHEAQYAKAAAANFGQANALQSTQNAYGQQQGALGKSMGNLAGQYGALATGSGLTAADYGLGNQLSQNIAGAQGGASPLAQRAALANMGQANQGVAASLGGDVAGTMQSGQAGMTGALGAQAGLYGQQGTQDMSAVQAAAQQAQFNPGLQEQQNKTNDLTALGYTNAGLGLQQSEGAAINNAWSDENQYLLGVQGLNNQQTNQIVGAVTTGAGLAAAAF